MPCLGMLAAALFIKAFALWLSVQYFPSETGTVDVPVTSRLEVSYICLI